MQGPGSPADLDKGVHGWRQGWELPDNCYFLLARLGKAKTVWMKKGPLLCSWECASLFLWSFLSPAKFSIWWHTQAGWYFLLRTTRWYFFILTLKNNNIQCKSVKYSVEQYCFIDLERSTVSNNLLFCFSSPQAFDFLFSILKMQISASILSCK